MPRSLGLGDLVVPYPRELRFFQRHGIGMIVYLYSYDVSQPRYGVRWLKSGKEMIFHADHLSRFNN